MVPRQISSGVVWISLFLFPLFLRLFWLLSLPRPYLIPDEIVYPQAGRAYVNAIMQGNLTSFRLQPLAAAHPPLAKLILGIFLLMAGDSWLSDIDISRILCALLGSLTCIIIWVHLKRYGNIVAFFGWFLASIDPLSIRYSIALLDVAAAMFLTISMWLFTTEGLNSRAKDSLIGVASGLATLCKYSALPIFLGAYLLEYTMMRKPRKTESLAVAMLSALVVSLMGNPLFWPSAVLGYSGLETLLSLSSAYSLGPGIVFIFDWLEPALRSPIHGHQVFYFSTFLSYAFTFPFRLFAESIVAWTLLGCLVHKLKNKSQLFSDQLSLVPWFVSSILFFWLVGKSRAEPYYAVMIGPPMTLLASLLLPFPRRQQSC